VLVIHVPWLHRSLLYLVIYVPWLHRSLLYLVIHVPCLHRSLLYLVIHVPCLHRSLLYLVIHVFCLHRSLLYGASNINVIQYSVFLYGSYTINYCLREFHPSLEAVNWSHRIDGKLKSCISSVNKFDINLSKHNSMEAWCSFKDWKVWKCTLSTLSLSYLVKHVNGLDMFFCIQEEDTELDYIYIWSSVLSSATSCLINCSFHNSHLQDFVSFLKVRILTRKHINNLDYCSYFCKYICGHLLYILCYTSVIISWRYQ
jgi:hypothetical protein